MRLYLLRLESVTFSTLILDTIRNHFMPPSAPRKISVGSVNFSGGWFTQGHAVRTSLVFDLMAGLIRFGQTDQDVLKPS